jgi:beta-glucuronidase
MIRRDRNHPSVFAWGLCNEINGQNPPAREFARRLYEEAKRLDPNRLRTYASNSMQNATLAADVAGEMDFVSWNDYYESWYRGSLEDLARNLDQIHKAFPSKPVVISEYGFCECNPRHVGGDRRRADVLQQHTRIFRERPWVGGAIFFSYNDYRTHIGDKGVGPLRQRVHGVVDLNGARKPSFDALRRESSPVAELSARREGTGVVVRVASRKTLPAYVMEGYTVRAVAYAHGNLPMEEKQTALPRLAPGGEATLWLKLEQSAPERVRVEVMRPTGFSAASAEC